MFPAVKAMVREERERERERERESFIRNVTMTDEEVNRHTYMYTHRYIYTSMLHEHPHVPCRRM
jgi:hypothetical protein